MGKEEWFWEGNVVDVLIKHLKKLGWIIQKTANTSSRERGVDIWATRKDITLLIEAKGYPSKFYERGINQGKAKPTNPRTQARHWYSEALMTAILRQADNPKARVAIAVPEFEVFLNLISRTNQALSKLGIGVYIVNKSGVVSENFFK